MKNTKHTPGPWVFSNNRDYSICVRTESGKEIHIAEYAVTQLSEEIDLANARLIAAAPELLTWTAELLKQVKQDNPGKMQGIVEHVEALINRARGEN